LTLKIHLSFSLSLRDTISGEFFDLREQVLSTICDNFWRIFSLSIKRTSVFLYFSKHLCLGISPNTPLFLSLCVVLKALCVAVCYTGVLQCVAVCCRVLHQRSLIYSRMQIDWHRILRVLTSIPKISTAQMGKDCLFPGDYDDIVCACVRESYEYS